MDSTHRLYTMNHPYSLARALQWEVKSAIRENDVAVLDNVKAVILNLASALIDFYASQPTVKT